MRMFDCMSTHQFVVVACTFCLLLYYPCRLYCVLDYKPYISLVMWGPTLQPCLPGRPPQGNWIGPWSSLDVILSKRKLILVLLPVLQSLFKTVIAAVSLLFTNTTLRACENFTPCLSYACSEKWQDVWHIDFLIWLIPTVGNLAEMFATCWCTA